MILPCILNSPCHSRVKYAPQTYNVLRNPQKTKKFQFRNLCRKIYKAGQSIELMLKELMPEEEREGKVSYRNLRIAYVSLLFIIFFVPYCLRDQLSGPWFMWTILAACILSLLTTFARSFYYVFKSE